MPQRRSVCPLSNHLSIHSPTSVTPTVYAIATRNGAQSFCHQLQPWLCPAIRANLASIKDI